MRIKDNKYLYDILHNGEQVVYKKVTTGFDGTVIDSTNESTYIDNVIYIKLKVEHGGGYAKRQATKFNVSSWVAGDGVSDDSVSFIKALTAVGRLKATLVIPHGINVNLNAQGIVIPENTTLEFSGGIISNGTLIGNKTIHKSEIEKCYDTITLKGSWKNEKAYLEWFIGEDKSVHTANWKALCNCVAMNTTVELLDMYSVNTGATLAHGYKTNNPVIITSRDKEKFGLILENILDPSYAYFDSIDAERELITIDATNSAYAAGINMRFKNITIQTRDYVDWKDGDYINNVAFTRWYKLQTVTGDTRIADMDYFIFEDCNVWGQIHNVIDKNRFVAADTALQAKYFLKHAEISDSNIKYSYKLIAALAYPKEAHLVRNQIYNNRQVVLQTHKCENVYVDDNNAWNDYIQTSTMTYADDYFTMAHIGGGGTLYFRRNKIKDILSLAGSAYAVYASVKNLIEEDNEIKDVLRKKTSLMISLVKLKETTNARIVNNTIEITREAYAKLGLLVNATDSITTVDNTIMSGLFDQNYGENKYAEQEIRGNTFRIPHINNFSYLLGHDLLMKDNEFHIEYIAPAFEQAVKINSIFHFRQRTNGINYKNLLFNDNKFYLDQIDNSIARIITWDRVSHEVFENNNNSYFLKNSAKVVFGNMNDASESIYDGHQAKKYIASGNYVSNGQFEDRAAANWTDFPYPWTTEYFVSIVVNKFKELGTNAGNGFIKTPEGMGVSKLEVLKNASNVMGVVRLQRQDFLNNPAFNQSGYPFAGILVKITADFYTLKNIKTSLSYSIVILGHASAVYRQQGATSNSVNGTYSTTALFSKKIQNMGSLATDIELLHKNFVVGALGYFVFNNISGYEKINIQAEVHQIDFTGYNTQQAQMDYYNSLVTPGPVPEVAGSLFLSEISDTI